MSILLKFLKGMIAREGRLYNAAEIAFGYLLYIVATY